jgi:hypothetical protein
MFALWPQNRLTRVVPKPRQAVLGSDAVLASKEDPFEDGPVDPRLIVESPYGPGEFESFRRTLQARLSAG